MTRKFMRQLALATALVTSPLVMTAATAKETVSFFVIAYNEPGLGQWWQKLVKIYQDKTGNEISIRNTTGSDYYTQLITEVASGSAADILTVNQNNVRELVAGGQLRPLNDFVDKPGIRELLADGAWDTLTVDGKIYGLPITGRTLELLYNSCHLKESGFDKPPANLTEFIDMARKLTKRDGSGTITRYGANMVNANEDPTYEMLLMLTLAHGGSLTDKDGNFTLTSEPVVKALTVMKTLYDEGVVPRGLMETDQRSLFATGSTAMTIDGQWQFPFIKENNAANFDCYKSAKHPWDGPATGGVNQGLAINAKAANPEAAWALLEIAASGEMQSVFSDHSPYIPYGRNALTQAQLDARPYLKPWAESITTAHPIVPRHHEDQFNTIWPIVAEAVVSTLQNGVAPADALAKAQAALEECCKK